MDNYLKPSQEISSLADVSGLSENSLPIVPNSSTSIPIESRNGNKKLVVDDTSKDISSAAHRSTSELFDKGEQEVHQELNYPSLQSKGSVWVHYALRDIPVFHLEQYQSPAETVNDIGVYVRLCLLDI